MKKILLIAAAAFVTLFWTMAASAQPKFAHVNFSELVQLMPEMDAARTTMDASQKEARDEFQGMYEEYQTKVSAYQQNASKWTDAIRTAKEKELTDIQQRLEEFNQTIQQELQQKQQELMDPIQKKAMETVQNIAKAAGYIYVFDAGTALYVDPKQSTDITPEARKVLGIAEGRTLESLYEELQAQQQEAAAALQ